MNPLVILLIRLLESIFIIGLCGSAVVFAITTVEDIENMFEDSEFIQVPKPQSGPEED